MHQLLKKKLGNFLKIYFYLNNNHLKTDKLINLYGIYVAPTYILEIRFNYHIPLIKKYTLL